MSAVSRPDTPPHIDGVNARGLAQGGAERTATVARVTVGALYLLSVGLLFASRVREFGDETDNLLGGLLMTRGERVYVDFFSSHMPLPYYLAAFGALLGATSLEQFRFFANALLVISTLTISWAFRARLPPPVIWLWATITLFAHALQFGEMLTASTVAGYGILLVGLLFFTTPGLRFSLGQQILLSAAIFLALQSELVAIFPLLLAGLAYVAVRVRASGRAALPELLRCTVLIVAPHLALLVGLAAAGMLPDFVYYAYAFNQLYYAQFVMNPSVVGILHDWEAQYRTYLVDSLSAPSGVQGLLVLANLAATVVVLRSRGWLWALGYYLFIALCHVRNEGGYYLCSYFSLALLVGSAINSMRHKRYLIPALGGLALAAIFVVQVGKTYELSRAPARFVPEVRAIQALTAPDERIFVLPFDPYVYLASERAPASTFTYFLPWHAIDPRIVSQLTSELEANRPPLIVFRRDELVNGQWLPRQYASSLYDFLVQQGYVPVDAPPDLFGDLLVRQDRAATAHDRLASDASLRAAATAERDSSAPHMTPP